MFHQYSSLDFLLTSMFLSHIVTQIQPTLEIFVVLTIFIETISKLCLICYKISKLGLFLLSHHLRCHLSMLLYTQNYILSWYSLYLLFLEQYLVPEWNSWIPFYQNLGVSQSLQHFPEHDVGSFVLVQVPRF